MIGAADSSGNSIGYTLDAMGNRVQEQAKDPSGNLARQITRVFDSMNRPLSVTQATTSSSSPGNNGSAPLVNISPASATASNSYDSAHVPAMAFDGDPNSAWMATFPTQWVEVDLGAPTVLRSIRLLTGQSPDVQTTHVVTGGVDPAPTNVLQTFSGVTTNSQWLEFKPNSPSPPVRYIRITTTVSPSWVAWRELEFYK